MAALVFDNRNFGASDGEPRQEIDPWAQVRDYRHAITYASTLPGGRRRADRDLGLELLAARHVLVVAAIDRRVKSVVSQVPLVSGHANARAPGPVRLHARFRAQFDADREARFRGEPPAMVPVVDADPQAPSALPTAGLLRVVHRDPRAAGAVLAKRGDAAQRRDVHRVRARRLPAVDQPRRRC